MMRCLNNPIHGAERERLSAFAGIVAQAVAELIRQGYTPITFSADVVAPGLPVIQIAADRRTAQAVADEKAEYYKHESLTGQPRSWGTLLNPPPGVRVIWIERSH